MGALAVASLAGSNLTPHPGFPSVPGRRIVSRVFDVPTVSSPLPAIVGQSADLPMTKSKFTNAMHRLYRSLYAAHGNKESYTKAELLALIKAVPVLTPSAFNLTEGSCNVPDDKIAAAIGPMLKGGGSVDHLILRLVLMCLRRSGTVSRFFPLKLVVWSLGGALKLTPD